MSDAGEESGPDIKIEGEVKKVKELPGKLTDCEATVVLFKSSLSAGVLQTKNLAGTVYCMFLADNVFIDAKDPRDIVGNDVFCDAWLMKDTDFVPYLASVVWKGVDLPPDSLKHKILSNPSSSDMDAYAKDVSRLGQLLREEKEERRSHKKHKKHRSRSRERDRKRDRRSGSSDRRSSRRKHSRSRSRSRSRDRSSRKKHRRRDSSYSDDSDGGGGGREHSHHQHHHHAPNHRGRGFPKRMRPGGGRGRFMRGGGGNLPPAIVPSAKPKLAIGRNVFPDSEEETEEGAGGGASGGGGSGGRGGGGPGPHLPAALRGRFRGRFIRIGRGAVPGLKLKRLVHGHDDTPIEHASDDHPGLGYTGQHPSGHGGGGGGGAAKSRGNTRWSRWQQLSRSNKDGDDKNGRDASSENKETSPVSSDEEYGGGSALADESSKKDRSSRTSSNRRSASPLSEHGGTKALVLTYENEEIGILSGPNDTKILFHVNQVWIKHPSAGYCQFAEIYSTADLSKHFYPGRQVNVLMRNIPKTRDVKGQAEVMWLQGPTPEDELFRTRELSAELNFHLAQYQAGKCGKLEMVLSVDKHSSMDGTVHEYVSYESGVIRLVGKDNGVVLFHLDQVWTFDDGKWILLKDIIKKPLQRDYLPVGSLVSLSVRKLPCSANSQLRYQEWDYCFT